MVVYYSRVRRDPFFFFSVRTFFLRGEKKLMLKTFEHQTVVEKIVQQKLFLELEVEKNEISENLLELEKPE